MADENPTGGERLVSLDLPADHISILRDRLRSWLAGIRQDLRDPDQLESPETVREEAQAYERLLVGLATGQVVLPDEKARACIEAAAETHDREGNYAEVALSHDALQDLLDRLRGTPA